MPRVSRTTRLGYPHLVVAQANGDGTLFHDAADYESYLQLLRQLTRDKLIKLYAYCLMPDELRLVIKPMRLSLSRVIQKLHGCHTQRMNQRWSRRGHLFRSRFRSIIFNANDLHSVIRGVHLWPVRTGGVRRVEAYPWSSYRAYLHPAEQFNDLIEAWEVLAGFASALPLAQLAFARYTEAAALDEDNWGVEEQHPGVGFDVGPESSDSSSSTSKTSLSIATLTKRVCLLLSVNMAYMRGRMRRQDLVMARRLLSTYAVVEAGRTVTELADFLHRDKGQISRLVAQGVDLLECNEAFRTLFESVRNRQAILSKNP